MLMRFYCWILEDLLILMNSRGILLLLGKGIGLIAASGRVGMLFRLFRLMIRLLSGLGRPIIGLLSRLGSVVIRLLFGLVAGLLPRLRRTRVRLLSRLILGLHELTGLVLVVHILLFRVGIHGWIVGRIGV
jgi:hypothetical protein